MEISMYIVWVVILVVAIIIEANTAALIGWAASIASIAAMITHSITKGNSIKTELVVFVFVWVTSWILFFVLSNKYKAKLHDSDDGYLGFVGQTYVAYRGNEDGFGEIKINDKHFRTQSKDKIKKGDKVTIIKIRGVTFIVEKGEK